MIVLVGKRIICKNAIRRFDGSEKEMMLAQLIRKQYPKGSSLVGEYLVDGSICCDLDDEIAAIRRNNENRFMRIERALF